MCYCFKIIIFLQNKFFAMVQYNPKDWIIFIFKIHKSDTFRKLFPMMIFIGVYTGLICFLDLNCFDIKADSPVRNVTIMHTTVGFVLSLLLAYRTNTAYDRWWEGRKLWGSLVNNSRNLALKLTSILKDDADKKYFRKIIPIYASILAKHLADEEISKELFIDFEIQIDPNKHKPNQVAKMIFYKINQLYEAKKISGEQLLYINNELMAFTDVCGACERIKNTPIPYSYSAFIKKFIFIYVMTLPIGFVLALKYYSIPVVIFIFYVLASLEIIAEEIEEPFGNDDNDLPTRKLADNIKKHVEELL
jgi:ion channel-forming bestrophin family protein